MDCWDYIKRNGKSFFSWQTKCNTHSYGDYSWPGHIGNEKDVVMKAYRLHKALHRKLRKVVDYEFARKMLVWKLNTGLYEKYRHKILLLIDSLYKKEGER